LPGNFLKGAGHKGESWKAAKAPGVTRGFLLRGGVWVVELLVKKFRKKPEAVIVADRVVESCYSGGRSGELLPVEELPNLAPPFGDILIESRPPSVDVSLPAAWGLRVRSGGLTELFRKDSPGERLDYASKLLGLMMPRVMYLNQKHGGHFLPGLFSWRERSLYRVARYVQRTSGFCRRVELDKDLAHWLVSASLYCDFGGELEGPFFRLSMALDFLGRYLPESVLVSITGPYGYEFCFGYLVNPLLFSLALFHCRGMYEENPRGGRGRVFEITSPGVVYRGHFKDYREKGLFGRHKGLFWWSSHVRGKRPLKGKELKI